ncbi:MAG: DUF362 domain-containing protein [Lentisphaerae bacterium]|nr:DUF362 domain-containing protein [Lentisphaerota bacterium]
MTSHAAPLRPSDARPTVAAVRCDSYADDAIDAALRLTLAPFGGMAAVVKPGQTVLLKPNLLSPRPPEQAVTTHPALVAALVRACRQAGAVRIWVGDSPAGEHADAALWEATGMARAVSAAGGELRSFRGAAAPVPCGKRHIPVPEWLSQVDVVISVPKLKTHLLTLLTCAMKNVYGLIPGETKSLYHGDYPSPRRMAAFLVDVYAALRPALTIVDAVEALEGDGPATGVPRHLGLLLAGRDGVAIDACCAGCLDLTPSEVPMVAMAARRGLGVADLRQIDLCGDGVEVLQAARLRRPRGRWLQRLPEGPFRWLTRLATYRPEIDQERCVRCGICAQTCSQQAIPRTDGRYHIDRARCILCMCCLESCPKHAIGVRSPVLRTLRLARRLRDRLRRGRQPPAPPGTSPQ